MTPLAPPPAPDEQTAIRRVLKKIQLPLISGKASALALFACLVVACTLVFLIGMTLQLPPWIRFELVMAVWWLVWALALAHVLYRGVRVSDDLSLHEPRSWFFRGNQNQAAKKNRPSSGSSWFYWGDVGYIGDGEGCAWVIGIVLAIGVALVLAWLLVEIIVPVLAFLFYAMIRGMLARIANDEHGCTNQPLRALSWGALWATVYTVPLALLVWVIHLIAANRAA
jgi:hypothetical protein